METYQLKRITIIVLALVNLSLLALLGQSELQQRSAEQQTLMQLKDLYLSSGMELTLNELPRMEKQTSATVQHSAEAEAAFAAVFLGEADVQESGSSMLYSSDLGAMRLRRNSAFELNMYSPFLTQETCLHLLAELGYTALPRHGGDSTVYLIQTVDGMPVIGSTVTLHFSGGYLSSAGGFYIADLQAGDSISSYTAADALSAFLQYALEQEIAPLSVRDIFPARQLSAETLFQSTLQPAWIIQTEGASYYVNHDGSEIASLQGKIS